MKRREFITLLCGATAWPHGAQAQQLGKRYRIGVLSPEAPLRACLRPSRKGCANLVTYSEKT